MSSVGEGIGKSIGPLLIVGGLIAGAYLFVTRLLGGFAGCYREKMTSAAL